MRKLVLWTGLLLLAGGAQAQINVRVGHFAPFAEDLSDTAVDVVVNGNTLLEDVLYGQFSEPIDAGADGTLEVEIVPSAGGDPAIAATLELDPGDYLVIAVGDGIRQPLDLLAIEQDLTEPSAGNVKLRVIHAAPLSGIAEETQVDVRTAGGDVVAALDSIGYGAVSDFFEVPEGTYDLKITAEGGQPNLIDPLPVDLGEGTVATLIATGDGITQPLGVTAIPIGELPLRAPVDNTATGLFYDPATSGQGLNLFAQPGENRLIGFFYTFTEDGTEQAWYIFDSCQTATGDTGCAEPGAFDGQRAEVLIKRVTDGVFNAGDEVTRTDVGTGTIEFQDCDSLRMTGDFGTSAGEVTLDYVRLGDRLACSAALEDGE